MKKRNKTQERKRKQVEIRKVRRKVQERKEHVIMKT